jgi:hypothetical protein
METKMLAAVADVGAVAEGLSVELAVVILERSLVEMTVEFTGLPDDGADVTDEMTV